MKVLLINHFPLEGSGSGTYTKNIALHLRKRGHEVCVIFPENRPVLMLPGIRIFPVMFSTGKASWSSLPFNFPCFTTHPQSRTTFADLSSGELAQYLTLFSSVLRQAVREFQPDVIHAQHAWCLSWLASLCDIPLVVTIHGTDLMGCRKWPVFRLCGGGDCGQRKGACHFTGQPGSCHFRAALLREQAVAAAQRL